jgi:hypothetical protein
MDTLASGDANLIGKGCPGTGPKGVCYFDEFVKWIQKEDYSWDGSTDVGKDLDPDVNHAADQLYKSDCQNQYDSHKLLPQKFPPEKYVGYKTVLDQITTRVENILDGKVPPSLQTQFEKLRGALGLVAEARTGDMTHYLVKDVNDLLRKEKTGWVCQL